MCTGTRIRTQTEGFGDLCTTVILYPYANPSKAKAIPDCSGTAFRLYKDTIKSLFDNIRHLAGAYRTTTLADSELEPLLHGDRLDQMHR